uniref:Putative secreted protein n=1 Tax=Ixodes ricinus TaxID=34613 RepID=A0A6B0UHW3_IXORI
MKAVTCHFPILRRAKIISSAQMVSVFLSTTYAIMSTTVEMAATNLTAGTTTLGVTSIIRSVIGNPLCLKIPRAKNRHGQGFNLGTTCGKHLLETIPLASKKVNS